MIRVVVADDERDVRLLLRVQLERQGFEVVGEAVDGREAIERCADTAPDALVLDLLMPGVNGFEAITALRHDRPKMAIIAYTAVAGDFVRKEMARLHIPLLLKSGDVTALARKLNEVVVSA